MELYCYQVIKVNEHPTKMSGVLESPAILSHMFGDEVEQVMNAMEEISKLKPAPLTVTTFQRLLTVFGLYCNRDYNNNDMVDVREIADFFETLSKHNIGTMEGLTKFVNDFHLNQFYYVTDCKPAPDQIFLLSTVILLLSHCKSVHMMAGIVSIFAVILQQDFLFPTIPCYKSEVTLQQSKEGKEKSLKKVNFSVIKHFT